MAHCAPLSDITTEVLLPSRYNNEIKEFWQHGHFSHFTAPKDIRINYAAFIEDTHSTDEIDTNKQRRCLVIVPGRSEGYLKYQELSYDLYQQGYDIFIIDHRGQGISQRLLENNHKGYVDSFDDYSDDLAIFINEIVMPHCDKKPYLLAHSMGGLIAARYLQKHPNVIESAVLSSPMIAVNSGAIPNKLAEVLITLGKIINRWFSPTPWYFIGQGDFKMSMFDNNPLMHSRIRYELFKTLYTSTAEIQLGGVTTHWLAEAIKAKSVVLSELNKIQTPLLVIQAGSDRIVDNQAQNEFCKQLHQYHNKSCPQGKPTVIPHAFHELFFESDLYRDQAVAHLLAWFNDQ